MNVIAHDEAAVMEDGFLQEFAETARRIEVEKAKGGVELDPHGKPETPVTLQDVGIVNRRTARRAGLRNPKRERKMTVPRTKR